MILLNNYCYSTQNGDPRTNSRRIIFKGVYCSKDYSYKRRNYEKILIISYRAIIEMNFYVAALSLLTQENLQAMDNRKGHSWQSIKAKHIFHVASG